MPKREERRGPLNINIPDLGSPSIRKVIEVSYDGASCGIFAAAVVGYRVKDPRAVAGAFAVGLGGCAAWSAAGGHVPVFPLP
jgi:hypothetical protein